MATAPTLAAARLQALHGYLGDKCDDLVNPVWDYLPPTYPNICGHVKGTRLPRTFVPIESDCMGAKEPEHIVGMVGPSTVVAMSLHGGPQVKPHSLLPLLNVNQRKQLPMSDASGRRPETLFELDGAVSQSCLVNGQFYYVLAEEPLHLFRRPVSRGPSAPVIIELPELCRQMKPVKGYLFLVGMETDWLYMLSPKSREFTKVLRLTRDTERESVWDDEDEWDPGFIIADPIFHDAILDKGRPSHVLFTKGNSKGALCLWRRGVGIVKECPEHKAITCRFVPFTNGRVCAGSFGGQRDEMFYVYDIYKDAVVARPESHCPMDLAPPCEYECFGYEDIVSLSISDDWKAYIAIRGRREAVRDNRIAFCTVHSVLQLRHYVSYTRHEDHGFDMEYMEEEERELYGSDYDDDDEDEESYDDDDEESDDYSVSYRDF
ncbi:hypothetical protein FOL47_001308 [Perkinsus chesapeaki]|uniref:Uncharacterized protein n=1 Tax=Perkinsus chesapeaki TaxID=330153 RepID=A0A7J6N0T8_PERCH|nr:hypothetical protein FOL47_001308 [Perkinsus chesapeaki]